MWKYIGIISKNGGIFLINIDYLKYIISVPPHRRLRSEVKELMGVHLGVPPHRRLRRTT